MRDDLLHAQASVDWAIAQFPSLQHRLRSWVHLNISPEIEETDAQAPHDFVVAIEKEPLPLSFNVEIGAYINAIRSALDLLATALADRHGDPNSKNAYFPIAASKLAFSQGNYNAAKFVQRLPQAEREIIESLKPYKGGNDELWSLHELDILRKHRRLIGVEPTPILSRVAGVSVKPAHPETGWLRGEHKTILALIGKGAPKPHVTHTFAVTIEESAVTNRQEISIVLDVQNSECVFSPSGALIKAFLIA